MILLLGMSLNLRLYLNAPTSTLIYNPPPPLTPPIKHSDLFFQNGRVMVRDNLVHPNVFTRYIFWLDWGILAIGRSSLDGSNRTALVTNNITYPHVVTLDTSQRLVYWTEGYSNEVISCVDYNGNNRRLIFEYSSLKFHYYDVFVLDMDISGDHLYFSEWYANALYEVKISSGALVRNISFPTVYKSSRVTGLRVIHSAKQQAG